MKKYILLVLALLPVALFADLKSETAHGVGQIFTVLYIAFFGYFAFLTLYVLKVQQQKELTFQKRLIAIFGGLFGCNLFAVGLTMILLGESVDIFLVSRLLLSEDSVLILLAIISALVMAYPNQIVRFCTKKQAV